MSATALLEATDFASLLSEDADRIRLVIDFDGGSYQFLVTENTAPDVLAFEPCARQLGVKPDAGGADRPFLFRVEFEALNFEFRQPAEDAVKWLEPATRPPFVSRPKLSPDATLLVLFAVNASQQRQTVQFDLMPAGALGASAKPIDPTIVNNPDPPV